MNKISHTKKQKAVIISMITELLILLLLIISLFFPAKKYYLTDKDNTITLPYGRYFVKCNYSISSDTDLPNYLMILNDNGNTEGILTSENFLHHVKNDWTAEFWVDKWKSPVVFNIQKLFLDGTSPDLEYATYEIESTNYVKNIAILIMVSILFITLIVYYIISRQISVTGDRIIVFTTLFLVILLSCIPLVGNLLIKGDDTLIHLVRLEGMATGFLSGQFPVRVEPILNGGYGYAFSTYYGSLLYNIPVFFRLMGFTIQSAYKLYVVFINIATVLVAYYAFKRMFSRRLAVIATIMYSLAPIRLVDIYQRGAVGEYTALVFLPLIIVGLWKLYTVPTDDKNYKNLWIMPVIGYFGVIESHVLSTEIYGIFTVLTCLILFKKTFKKETLFVLIKIVLITVVLNIGYLLPFIESLLLERTYISSGHAISTSISGCLLFSDLFKFVYEFVEFPEFRNYMFPGLGPTAIPILILFIYSLIKRKVNNHKKLMVVCLIITVIASFLSLNVIPYEALLTYLRSKPTGISLIDYAATLISVLIGSVQFGERFITIASSTYIVFVIALISNYEDVKFQNIFGLAVALITIVQFIVGAKLTMDEMSYFNFYTMTENDKETSCTVGLEYLPLDDNGRYAEIILREVGTYHSNNIVVTDYSQKYNNVNMHAQAEPNLGGSVELPLFYYRGYKAIDVDTGKKVDLVRSEGAMLKVNIPSGYNGNIKVYYAGKLSWHIAEIVSVITLILIIIYSMKRKNYYGQIY